jgi:hypothetical protein
MKQSEKIWIQNLARVSLGKTLSHAHRHQINYYSINGFLDELCYLIKKYVCYYNDLVSEAKPQEVLRILETAAPRSGLILLKGGDKMIVALSGKFVRVRTVQMRLESERNFQCFDFELKQNEQSSLFWHCMNDGQLVNPELVVQNYLSFFLISGCGNSVPTLRLLVSSHP